MPVRCPFVSGKFYHVFNKSIAGYKIFPSHQDFDRMVKLMMYYQMSNPPMRYSFFIDSPAVRVAGFEESLIKLAEGHSKLVGILAYCIMPTHVHLLLKQIEFGGISRFMSNILNSYARYFNRKNKRQGPLWTGHFKAVPVETDYQLLHLSRYIHLNPTTEELVKHPVDWRYSSYAEYIGQYKNKPRICQYKDIIDLPRRRYQKFVEDRILYQQELARIKRLLLD